MHTKQPFIFILLLVLASGCITRMPTSTGRPIDTDYVKSIEKGKTTIEEVRLKLGDPKSVTQGPDSEVWTYAHWVGKPAMFGAAYSKSSTQVLTISFKNGKVADYSLSTGSQ